MLASWLSFNWTEMLLPQHPLEIVVRGTITYLGLLLLLRVVLKRQSGNLATNDLLVIVLIADAIQNGMAGEYTSVFDGLLLVTTIVGWDYFLDWLSFRWVFLAKLLKPAPVLLVSNGTIQRKNLRRELVSVEELWTALRLEGIDDIRKVKRAFLESEGEISVIPH